MNNDTSRSYVHNKESPVEDQESSIQDRKSPVQQVELVENLNANDGTKDHILERQNTKSKVKGNVNKSNTNLSSSHMNILQSLNASYEKGAEKQ